MQPGQFVSVSGQPMVQVQGGSADPSRCSKHSSAAKALGIFQLISAVLSVGIGITQIIVDSWFGVISAGIWGGFLFFLPAGILGVVSGVTTSRSARKCLAIGCMVMSILSSVVAVAIIGLNVTGAIISADYYSDPYYYGYISVAAIAMDAILALVGLMELVVSIVASVYCCRIIGEPQVSNNSVMFQHMPQQGLTNVAMMNQPATPNMGWNNPPAAPSHAPSGFVSAQDTHGNKTNENTVNLP